MLCWDDCPPRRCRCGDRRRIARDSYGNEAMHAHFEDIVNYNAEGTTVDTTKAHVATRLLVLHCFSEPAVKSKDVQ